MNQGAATAHAAPVMYTAPIKPSSEKTGNAITAIKLTANGIIPAAPLLKIAKPHAPPASKVQRRRLLGAASGAPELWPARPIANTASALKKISGASVAHSRPPRA